MGSRKVVAVLAASVIAGFGAVREAGASATDFYGNNFDENVLIPFAQCGPGGNDTLFAITDPNEPGTSAGGVHVIVFSRDSVERCDFCINFTPGDVYPDSFCSILDDFGGCGLTVEPDGSVLGYITVEGNQGGAGPNRACIGEKADQDDGDAFYGNIYYTDLGNNRATGLPAATFDEAGTRDTADVVGSGFESDQEPNGLSQFPLVTPNADELAFWEISFRFLQALEGDQSLATTRVVVWSDTSGNCVNISDNPVPDSSCLGGSQGASPDDGDIDSFDICAENETCTSRSLPPLNRELNVFAIDGFVQGTFPTDGGYFNLQAVQNTGGTPTSNGGRLGETDSPLHLIGITDQEGAINGVPTVRAAFYAPRD